MSRDILNVCEFRHDSGQSDNMGGGGGNSKKVNTHPKIPDIDLDFFRVGSPNILNIIIKSHEKSLNFTLMI